MTQTGYASDLTDTEWELIGAFFEQRTDNRGSKGKHPIRLIVDACMYIAKTGCQWDMLPKNFPPKSTVFQRFRAWRNKGVFEKANKQLVEACRLKKTETPTLMLRLSMHAR